MKSLVVAIFMLMVFTSYAQTIYEVGTSSVSIEPTYETVSLTLAGYAGPPLGRFTITWEDKGPLHDVADMACVGNILYVVKKDGVLAVLENTGLKNIPSTRSSRFRLMFIASHQRFLYGVLNNGDLLVCEPSVGIRWKRVGNINDVTAFTASDENLYAATAKGELLMGTIFNESVTWKNIGHAKDVISMTCDQRRLYAVTADNYLLQRHLKRHYEDWQRIGYHNKETYTIDVKQVVYVSTKLCALAADSHFYEAKHHTLGNLSARAMAIKNGKDMAVIVGVDVCGLNVSFTNSIKEEISRRKGIPAKAMMINASHTHFAPVTQSWQTWGLPNQYPDSLYLNKVVRVGIIRAIEEAIDHMVPSYLSFGRDTTDIGRNRSLKGDLAVYDHAVDVIQAESIDGKIKTLLFLTGCHPVFTDPDAGHYSINANFPGYARELLENAGYNHTIFLQGCAGDINPKHPFKTSGKMLAADVLRAVKKELLPVNGKITVEMDSIMIPVKPWSKEQIQSFKDENTGNTSIDLPGGDANDSPGRDVRWADMMLKYYAKGMMPKYAPIYIQTFRIGDWKLIGLSREATTEFGMAIKSLWPDQKVSIVAYTNDVSSYLSTDPHIIAQDYEGYDSFFWYGQPSPFPLGVFDTVIDYFKRKN